MSSFLFAGCADRGDLHSFPTRRSSDLKMVWPFAKVVGEMLDRGQAQSDGFGRISSTLEFFQRSEEHTSELQSRRDLVCRLLLEKKKVVPVQSILGVSLVQEARVEALQL